MSSNLENSAVATGLEKSVFIPIPKKGNAKECSSSQSNLRIALLSHASKVMLKILQARLQQYVNGEFPDIQAGFRKGRGTRDQIDNICWIIEKARGFQKNIYFCFIDYAKAFNCVDQWVNWGTKRLSNFLRDPVQYMTRPDFEEGICFQGQPFKHILSGLNKKSTYDSAIIRPIELFLEMGIEYRTVLSQKALEWFSFAFSVKI